MISTAGYSNGRLYAKVESAENRIFPTLTDKLTKDYGTGETKGLT
jgi:hypothetical protein